MSRKRKSFLPTSLSFAALLMIVWLVAAPLGSAAAGVAAPPPANPATSYHTITVDGDMGEWVSDEDLEVDNGGTFYITWDATNLYIGLEDVNVDTNGVFFVYFDTVAGGTTTGQNWNGTHTLPFAADYAIAADADGNIGWLNESGGTWNWTNYPYGKYVGWTDVPNSELEVPWSAMGSPTQMSVMALFQNQADNGVTASWPTLNPARNSG